MRAVTIRAGAIHVDERPDPVPGLGEVLIKVASAGLNGADLLQVRGAYPAPPGSPADIPGLELAGEVVALGEGVTRFVVGDRVMGIVGGGGQAELAVVHERQLSPVPSALDLADAGGFPEVFTTAHDAVVVQAGCDRASASSCTVRPAASARRRSSWRRRWARRWWRRRGTSSSMRS